MNKEEVLSLCDFLCFNVMNFSEAIFSCRNAMLAFYLKMFLIIAASLFTKTSSLLIMLLPILLPVLQVTRNSTMRFVLFKCTVGTILTAR